MKALTGPTFLNGNNWLDPSTDCPFGKHVCCQAHHNHHHPFYIALNEIVDQLPQVILLHSFILPAKHTKALGFVTHDAVDPKESEAKHQ